MSQGDNFTGGFLLGTLLGSIAGGVVGALLASRALNATVSEDPLLNVNHADAKLGKAKRRSLKSVNGQQADIEVARRSLEDKIAQLNDAIDDVRHQLGGVNGTSQQGAERSTAKEQ